MLKSVKLIEMRPSVQTPAHHTSEFGELVCSNSFGALSPDRAAGLLQQELRTLDSLVIHTHFWYFLHTLTKAGLKQIILSDSLYCNFRKI